MPRALLRAFIRHLVVTAVVTVPVALIVFITIQHLAGKNEGGTLVIGIGNMVVLYPGVLVPTLIGVLLYTVILFAVGRSSRRMSRTVAILLTPVVLLPWMLFPIRDLLAFGPLLTGLAVGLLLLGALADTRSAAASGEPDAATA